MRAGRFEPRTLLSPLAEQMAALMRLGLTCGPAIDRNSRAEHEWRLPLAAKGRGPWRRVAPQACCCSCWPPCRTWLSAGLPRSPAP